jgi:hypothetical protein
VDGDVRTQFGRTQAGLLSIHDGETGSKSSQGPSPVTFGKPANGLGLPCDESPAGGSPAAPESGLGQLHMGSFDLTERQP